MQGKIVKGISGFYYVHVVESGIYECKAKGAFRQQKIKPLVGDNVNIDVLDEENKKGNLIEILPRMNQLIRPAVANIHQALVVFAAAKPQPNLNLLDRFLVLMRMQNIPVCICFNKVDLIDEETQNQLKNIYESCGFRVLFISVKQQTGIDILREQLLNKTTTLAGPSGVGKSSLINLLQPEAQMETGVLSKKIERGKQTTRHTQLIHMENQAYIMDTPGFSSLYLTDLEAEELKDFYPEFGEYEPMCRFQGCNHISEPDCGIKTAVEEGKISPIRYENYKLLYEELKDKKKY